MGVGGSTEFNVSEPLFIDLGPGSPTTDTSDQSVFNQRFGPINAQVGPLNAPGFPDGIDVFGMPTMAGKVIVMDSRNVRLPTPEDLFGDPADFPGLRTYTYDPGTPFRPETGQTDPGIPDTNLHVSLSYSTFDDFTEVTPAGAQGPTLNRNPFIGPAPLPESGSGADDTPAVKLGFGSEQVSGSLLLDTGAAASFISSELAAGLNVRIVPGTEGTANPQLEMFDPVDGSSLGLLDEQFTTTLTGVGGPQTLAGFYLDSLLVKTLEGDVLNDADPAHLRYLGAPVYINDFELMNPSTDEEFILDGVFGMNYLTTSADTVLDPVTGFPISITEGNSPFPCVVFDEPNGILSVTASVVPIPAAGWLFLTALTVLGVAARQRPSTRLPADHHAVA